MKLLYLGFMLEKQQFGELPRLINLDLQIDFVDEL